MSTFDNPFDPKHGLNRSGCACGRHVSQIEHERDAAPALQCTPVESEDKRYEGVVASAVMRAVFPQDAARRAFLKSVGASTALAAISQFFPLETATEVFAQGGADREEGPQGRLHPDHLRHADHHGAADGLLRKARPQRRSDQDGRLGGDPRQDHQQGIRRRPHAVADAARDLARRRLERDPLHGAGDREHQRPGHHARDQAQGQARSERLEGLQVRGAVRLFDAQLSAALLSRRARHRSRPGRADPRRAAAGNGGQPARRQHRRLPRPRSDEPARRLRRRRLHPHPVEGHLGGASVLRLRGLEGVRHADRRTPTRRCSSRSSTRPPSPPRPRTASRSPRRSRRRTTQPAGHGAGADPDRHLRRRARQREEGAEPRRLRSVPVGVLRGLDHDPDEALGSDQGRRRLRRRRQAGVPRHRHDQADEGGRPDAAGRHVEELRRSWARPSIRPSPRTTSRASRSSGRDDAAGHPPERPRHDPLAHAARGVRLHPDLRRVHARLASRHARHRRRRSRWIRNTPS